MSADLSGRTAVEVGAGTGKATVAFAALGTSVVCIGPDRRMAEVLRRTTSRCPGVRVHSGSFEERRPGGRRSGLLFAATSWHWVDPVRRWDLVRDALVPGGAVALFWNPAGGTRYAGAHRPGRGRPPPRDRPGRRTSN